MKRTLNQIKSKISDVAEKLRNDAGLGGYKSDFRASDLEKKLSFFIEGIRSTIKAYNLIISEDTMYEVPLEWQNYFLEEEEEYKEYLRLKEKFKNFR